MSKSLDLVQLKCSLKAAAFAIILVSLIPILVIVWEFLLLVFLAMVFTSPLRLLCVLGGSLGGAFAALACLNYFLLPRAKT